VTGYRTPSITAEIERVKGLVVAAGFKFKDARGT